METVVCVGRLQLARYECEAHSHLSYYCYVMGVKLICILNYECECVRIRALYFMLYTCVSMWRWIKTGSF